MVKTPASNFSKIIENLGVVPEAQNRWNISLKSPVAGAKYLRAVLDAFVEVIKDLIDLPRSHT